ncbi:hypothetical protein LTR84_011324 [Exophiala bonariae]|uniref:Glucose-methanol-choline oxidoreductase N-terminal domain-containing protein n=1 Tax=Exophiala bonariae TaxID=1690606 RepID=A0AAV9MS90_9EURO|nr:hypothetical protein LTR84_011324 [Exophiala bonariae]
MGSLDETIFDFIVVGAGNSGAIVAGNLARSSTRPRVLLIEKGGDNKREELRVASERFTNVYLNPEIATRYETTPQKHLNGRVLEYLRGNGLGGSSIANFLAYIRGSSADYNAWADIVGDESWAWTSVLEAYREIENLHFDDNGDKDPDGFVSPQKGAHGSSGPLDITLPSRSTWPTGLDLMMKAALKFGWPLNPDQNAGELVGVGAVSTTTHKGFRTTSATAWLNDLPDNISLWTNSTVTRLLFDGKTGSAGLNAIGVVLADGREVRARNEVILSLGTIDTPKLLMLSGIGPRDELKKLDIPCLVNQPKIGKDMIDHNYIVLNWGVSSQLGTSASFERDPDQIEAARSQWKKEKTGPDATRNLTNIIGFLKFNPARSTTVELDRLEPAKRAFIQQRNVPQIEIFLQGAVLKELLSDDGLESLLIAVMLMNPQSRGSVTLASSDPAAPPIIETNYFSHPYDPETFVNGVAEALAFVESDDIAKHIVKKNLVPESDSREDILAFAKQNLMSVLHPVGTVRMGHKDDNTACVDSDFRVRGVGNLRVIDLSVCPVITNNHTAATAYLVGQMGWKRLAVEYKLNEN